MISTSGSIIIVVVTLSVFACVSPARLPRNQDADSDEKEPDWERELLDLRSYTPGIYSHGMGEEIEMDGIIPEINSTGYYPEQYLPYSLPSVPYTIPSGGVPASVDSEELELHALPELYGIPPAEPYLYYPEMEHGYVEYNPIPRLPDYPTADPLVESLAYFLATPEDHWESVGHQMGDEIDFGDVWEVDAVRRIGKEANVPQYLIDSVDPEADENLLELMVRIAEDPEKWRSIHSAIERLDRSLADKATGESFERKEVEKRSSGYYHRGDQTKRKKLKKRKKKKHEWDEGEDDGEEEEEEMDYEEDGYFPGNGGRSHGRRSNRKKIRHSSGEYSGNQKPRSAAYASVVFPDREDNNFDRWKVRYEPIEPGDVEGGVPKDYKHPGWSERGTSDYKRLAKKRLKMKEIASKSGKKKKEKSEEEMRRWELLKSNKHLVDKWTRLKSVLRVDDRQEEGEEEEEEALGPAAAKEKSLATNNWVTPKEQKENWPHFAYHRVTSSPSVQQRDAGAQPRHRSAYVAVSVVPTNSTGSSDPKVINQIGLDGRHDHVSNNEKNLPDFLSQILREPITNEEKIKSLKNVEEKFHMKSSERLRLEEIMSDGSATSNTTT